VTFDPLLKGIGNADGRIAVSQFLDHGEAEHLADVAQHPEHRVDDAACLHPLHELQDVGRTQWPDRLFADERKHVTLEPAHHALVSCFAARAGGRVQPVAGDGFEQLVGRALGLLFDFLLFET
jgi:hypothetical protein